VATSLSQYALALSHCFWLIASSNRRDRTGTLVGFAALALRRMASASATGCLKRSSSSASLTARSGVSGSSSTSLRLTAYASSGDAFSSVICAAVWWSY